MISITALCNYVVCQNSFSDKSLFCDLADYVWDLVHHKSGDNIIHIREDRCGMFFLRWITHRFIFPCYLIFLTTDIFFCLVVLSRATDFTFMKLWQLPWWALTLLCLSKRLHSIFMLRLFNDCIAMMLLHSAIAALLFKKWHLGLIIFRYLSNVPFISISTYFKLIQIKSVLNFVAEPSLWKWMSYYLPHLCCYLC